MTESEKVRALVSYRLEQASEVHGGRPERFERVPAVRSQSGVLCDVLRGPMPIFRCRDNDVSAVG